MTTKRSSWNKGLTKETHPSIARQSRKVSGRPAWNKGLTKETDDRIKRMAESKIGFKFSDETRKKMSVAAMGRPGYWTGKHLSEETKKKLSEANIGKTISEETKHKLSVANSGKNNPMYGRKHSEETRRTLSKSHMGQTSWSKGLTKETHPSLMRISEKTRGKNHHMYGKRGKEVPGFGRKRTEESKRKMSLAQRGKKLSEETRKKISEKNSGENHWNFGRHLSEQTKMRISIGNKGKLSKENNPNWKGGITPINKLLRRSLEYKQWRKKVFIRDNYQCQVCEKRGVLHPHHLKPFAGFPLLRFVMSNGITLCPPCHKAAHKKMKTSFMDVNED